MKIIKYILAIKTNIGTKKEPVWEISEGGRVELKCTESNLEANEAIAKKEAYNSEYTIEDDGQPDPVEVPSQLDIIEAQVTYTAMMTDTLLEG